MKNLLIIFTLILSANFSNAQNFKFGKISKEELQEKYHSKDSATSAAILYRNEDIKFIYATNEGFMQEREVHERIKIYNKDGFDWATKKLYLYRGNGQKEILSGLKGFSYNLVNGKIEKDKLKGDGKFEDDHNEYTRISSFTLPNVKEGTVIEYKYKIVSPRYSIDDIIFQYSIPVNKLEVRIATPEYLVYNKQYNLRASYLPKIVESSETTTIPFDYQIDVCTLSEEDIPALREEAYAGNMNNYRSKMAMELTAYLNNLKLVEKSFSSTWEEVSKTIYDNSDFGGQLSKFNIYKDDLEAALTGVEDDFEKAFLVEELVKSKVKWNGNYGKYAQNGVRSAYKDGKGNVGDINLMVVSMLRSHGVNANPVVLSTRNNGFPLFPTREGFNYVICCVQKDDQYLLIDATEQYSTHNVLPLRTLNWQGRLIQDNDVSRWVDLQPKSQSVESTMLNVKINEDFTLTGKVAKQLTDYIAYFYRDKYVNMTTEDQIKSLEKDKGDLEIDELNVENLKNSTEPIKVSYDYEFSDGIDEVGDKLYFTPLLFLRTKENPFKLENRQYPIDFIIPNSDKQRINIMLPEGYVVESLPKSEVYEFNNANVKFTYYIKQNGKFLQLVTQMDIINPIILSTDYEAFKSFYGRIVEKQAEQIVLTKA
ncbi:transglutaminase domain-containing protein [Winogradskyella schleiferi]|uniref:transglutaminase domain-containing protein n=1 Tax=Winogradskyella schleiferi TaxID=2686078 RepID=UPI0015BD7561|nr:transglutaminase domain-containing protein [Winogradskyella schleiferi]